MMPPKYMMTVAELIEQLKQYPGDMPVMGPGNLRDVFRQNLETGDIKRETVAAYTCDGGHLGRYDLYQPASQPLPDFFVSKDGEFEAVVFYPSVRSQVKRMKAIARMSAAEAFGDERDGDGQ